MKTCKIIKFEWLKKCFCIEVITKIPEKVIVHTGGSGSRREIRFMSRTCKPASQVDSETNKT